VLLGQIADYLGAGSHVLISRKRLTLVFVLSDVITFLIQVGLSFEGVHSARTEINLHSALEEVCQLVMAV